MTDVPFAAVSGDASADLSIPLGSADPRRRRRCRRCRAWQARIRSDVLAGRANALD
jgi:hypothetical protein